MDDMAIVRKDPGDAVEDEYEDNYEDEEEDEDDLLNKVMNDEDAAKCSKRQAGILRESKGKLVLRVKLAKGTTVKMKLDPATCAEGTCDIRSRSKEPMINIDNDPVDANTVVVTPNEEGIEKINAFIDEKRKKIIRMKEKVIKRLGKILTKLNENGAGERKKQRTADKIAKIQGELDKLNAGEGLQKIGVGFMIVVESKNEETTPIIDTIAFNDGKPCKVEKN